MKESILRTVVPILYALLVKVGFVAWLGGDEQLVTTALTLVASGLIYVALRFAETHKAALGWLLGYPAQPVYVAPADHLGDEPVVEDYQGEHVAE